MTAEAFARLGVPAMGLVLLCQTDAVTHARRGAGISTAECEQLLAGYQTAPVAKYDALADEIERQADRVIRAIETCTNCYGEK